MLVSLLFHEASLIPVQGKLWSLNKLSPKSRRKQIELNSKLFNIWDVYNTKTTYDENIMTSMCLLHQVSTMYSNFNNDNFKKCIDDDRVSESEYETDSDSN